MATNEILDQIYAAIQENNQTVSKERQLEMSPDTVLFGLDGKVDSLRLVSLIVAIEERVQDHFGEAISIADERALSQQDSPFRNVGALASYVNELVTEAAND